MRRSRFVIVAAAGGILAACGGGGGSGGGGSPRVLSVRFLAPGGVDVPSVPSTEVPRNSWVEIVFSTSLDPASVVDPNLQVRSGPHFSEASLGTFHVDGARVLFDPTHIPGAPDRPLGFPAETDFQILVPAGVPTGEMVRGADGTPVRATFAKAFHTSSTWVHEEQPPRLVDWHFEGVLPDGSVSPSAALVLRFDEALDPTAIRASVGSSARPEDGVELRYDADDSLTAAAGLGGQAILVRPTLSTDGTSIRVEPVFTWGDDTYRFHGNVLTGLRDIAGNALAASVPLGSFRCAGGGTSPPRRLLDEEFLERVDADTPRSTAVWDAGAGVAAAAPVTTRRVRVRGADAVATNPDAGYSAYIPMGVPLTGAELNQYVPDVSPPTAQGRRVLMSFTADEIGQEGEIVEAAWGPAANATFAATYPDLRMRIGRSVSAAPDLIPDFESNFATTPLLEYRGAYVVAQHADVGNEVADTTNTSGLPAVGPLFTYSGFVSYPPFSAPYPWDPRAGALLLDVSASEGDTWQDVRGYQYSIIAAAASGPLPLLGPRRLLMSTHLGDQPDPPDTQGGVFVPPSPNPTIVLLDTAFTVVRRRSAVQSRFYTPAAGDPSDPTPAGPRSRVTTLGTASVYEAPVFALVGAPAGSATIEFQGAMAVDPASDRTDSDPTRTTAWSSDPHSCDGYPYLRWRVSFVADLATQQAPKVDWIVIPIRKR